MASAKYEEPVCYMDGWHYTVVDEVPVKRLYLEDDSTYRLAKKGDKSWHERKHERLVALPVGTGGIPQTEEEMEAYQRMVEGI